MYTRKSAWAEMTFLKVIFFWLIIPIIVANVVAHNYTVTILDKAIIKKSGVFSKSNEEYALAGVTQISVNQSFWGRICHYGDVRLSLAGGKNVTLEGVLNPDELKNFIEKKLTETANSKHFLVN